MCRIWSRVFCEMETAAWCVWGTCPRNIFYISRSNLWRRNSGRFCFGAVLAAWGMCQSPPWSLSHFEVSGLWGASVVEEYPLTVKTTLLVSAAPLASVTCWTSWCLCYLKPEAVVLLGRYDHLPSDCSPHQLIWWCLSRSLGSNNILL